MNHDKILLVVPCYNEANRLDTDQFVAYTALHHSVYFHFVDDGSTDATSAVLAAISKQSEHCSYLSLAQNQGKAEAVRQGVLSIKAPEEYDFIGYYDADLATPLTEIQHFLSYLKRTPNCDFLLGSRFLRLGSSIDRKRLRHLGGRVMATLVSITLQEPVYDSQCGAKLIRSKYVKALFKDPLVSNWLFDVELLMRWKQTKEMDMSRVYELPLNAWKDIDGSKLKFTDFFKAPLELWKIYRAYMPKR